MPQAQLTHINAEQFGCDWLVTITDKDEVRFATTGYATKFPLQHGKFRYRVQVIVRRLSLSETWTLQDDSFVIQRIAPPSVRARSRFITPTIDATPKAEGQIMSFLGPWMVQWPKGDGKLALTLEVRDEQERREFLVAQRLTEWEQAEREAHKHVEFCRTVLAKILAGETMTDGEYRTIAAGTARSMYTS